MIAVDRTLFGKVDKPFYHEGDHENNSDNKSKDHEFYDDVHHGLLLLSATEDIIET